MTMNGDIIFMQFTGAVITTNAVFVDTDLFDRLADQLPNRPEHRLFLSSIYAQAAPSGETEIVTNAMRNNMRRHMAHAFDSPQWPNLALEYRVNALSQFFIASVPTNMYYRLDYLNRLQAIDLLNVERITEFEGAYNFLIAMQLRAFVRNRIQPTGEHLTYYNATNYDLDRALRNGTNADIRIFEDEQLAEAAAAADNHFVTQWEIDCSYRRMDPSLVTDYAVAVHRLMTIQNAIRRAGPRFVPGMNGVDDEIAGWNFGPLTGIRGDWWHCHLTNFHGQGGINVSVSWRQEGDSRVRMIISKRSEGYDFLRNL